MLSKTPSLVAPGSFALEQHYYPQVQNAHIHPLLRYFFTLTKERLVVRYCHLNPHAKEEKVRELLSYRPRYLRWAGADLFCVTNSDGNRRVVVIETNSCPSGQKSMPVLEDYDEQGGYKRLLREAFLPLLKKKGAPRTGDLAVLWDKNPMEIGGYAAAMAELTGEHVHVIHCGVGTNNVRLGEERLLEVLTESGEWKPIRGAFRYVTQRPWDRIQPLTRTVMLNPVISCLAGGRNKLMAAKAYDMLNGDLANDGMRLETPETIWDVSLDEVPFWLERMGGVGVLKNPYSNAGQGVWTVTNKNELEEFMNEEHTYDKFIVQSLIGNSSWSSSTTRGHHYHIGTLPDRMGQIFVADFRFMVGAGPDGFFPVAMYARRAREPLTPTLAPEQNTWGMLGTNLSVKNTDGTWGTESERLLVMDSRNFNRLGLGIDDLINAYFQTVMAVVAIDRMATRLVNSKGKFRRRLFASLNPDPALVEEIIK